MVLFQKILALEVTCVNLNNISFATRMTVELPLVMNEELAVDEPILVDIGLLFMGLVLIQNVLNVVECLGRVAWLIQSE